MQQVEEMELLTWHETAARFDIAHPTVLIEPYGSTDCSRGVRVHCDATRAG